MGKETTIPCANISESIIIEKQGAAMVIQKNAYLESQHHIKHVSPHVTLKINPTSRVNG